jgi:hypothetical protein
VIWKVFGAFEVRAYVPCSINDTAGLKALNPHLVLAGALGIVLG